MEQIRMRHLVMTKRGFAWAITALVLCSCGKNDAPVQAPAKPAARQSEAIGASHPDPTITAADVKARLREPRTDYLFNTVSMLVIKRHDKEIVTLLRDVWSLKKAQYPDLAWSALEQPIVRVALAQTLAQADVVNAEYRTFLLQAINSDDRLVHTHAILALGTLGDDAYVPVLEKLVHSSEKSMSSAAITSLASMRRSSANALLEQLLKTYADDPWRSKAIGEALQMFGGK